MTQLKALGYLLLQLFQLAICAVGPDPDCSKLNAVPTTCATNCAIDSCPTTENYSLECQTPEKCVPGCKCRFNEVFAENGTCISAFDCPPFACNRPNEEFVACPSLCSELCSDASPQGRCAENAESSIFITPIVIRCTPKCRCKDGYWRKSGSCVLYENCTN